VCVCFVSASDRLVATKEEVAQLRSRFEAELARQATKAAKLAAASKLLATIPQKSSRAERADRAQQRARTNGIKGGVQGADTLDPTLLGIKPRGKKKKRSALANAGNPHHLKNYVPSRLPHSGQTNSGQTNANSQNYLGPPPLRFLSAEIPPRRRKKPQVTPTSQLTNPVDEWICAWCEHRLFFGDNQEYRRAVRMRKKILRRRRRAQERAAAAASGTSKFAEKSTPSSHGEYEEEISVGLVPKPVKAKGELNRDGEKGVEHGSFG
jgi:hypothetical protein